MSELTCPPIPPGCPHFVWHDYQDGRGDTLIFWCSEPFWSHDHGEPWRVEGELSPMKRLTIAAVAEKYWSKEYQRLVKAWKPADTPCPSKEFDAARSALVEWRVWGEAKA